MMPPFLFGTATAAHQVEGGNVNDWTRWEDAGRVAGGIRSGFASQQWTRYPEDFQLLAAHGLNAQRFSVEWSRLEPAPGRFDPAAFARYRHMISTMKAHHLEPILTLHHFTLPLWMADSGGFLNPDAPRIFARFVHRVVEELGDGIQYYITLNEPLVYAVNGYLYGIWPPGQTRLKRALKVAEALVPVHQCAFHAIKSLAPSAKVGIAHHLLLFDPWTSRPWDRTLAKLLGYLFNWRFMNHVRETQDFLGINYYTRNWASLRSPLRPYPARPSEPVSNLGWSLYPEGLRLGLLEAYRRYRLPILITENGVSTDDDTLRQSFIVSHLRAVSDAIDQEVPVFGYCYWSSIDNFEWEMGFGPRFGLIEVDYATGRRFPRQSLQTYAKCIRSWPH